VKILVTGSRDWGDYAAIYSRLSALPGEHEEITIVHGACSRIVCGFEVSADMLADAAATCLGFEVKPYPADWDAEPKRAGIMRNLKMLDEQPDLVLAFQRAGSRGTQRVIDEARRRGIPVEVHTS
jgi:hypothetical protein